MELEGDPGNFTATVYQKPRFVDLAKCTSCGDCVKVCPITLPNEYDEGLSDRKAIYKQYPQAIPGAFAISKRGTAPCKATCPAHVSIQGYIALINEGKYREALELFKEDHPFPVFAAGCATIPAKKTVPETTWINPWRSGSCTVFWQTGRARVKHIFLKQPRTPGKGGHCGLGTGRLGSGL